MARWPTRRSKFGARLFKRATPISARFNFGLPSISSLPPPPPRPATASSHGVIRRGGPHPSPPVSGVRRGLALTSPSSSSAAEGVARGPRLRRRPDPRRRARARALRFLFRLRLRLHRLRRRVGRGIADGVVLPGPVPGSCPPWRGSQWRLRHWYATPQIMLRGVAHFGLWVPHCSRRRRRRL